MCIQKGDTFSFLATFFLYFLLPHCVCIPLKPKKKGRKEKGERRKKKGERRKKKEERRKKQEERRKKKESKKEEDGL